MDFFSILTLIGGLALFLYGMDVMGDNLKKLAGGQLESFLGKLTSNRFKGFLLGFLVTAIIQSSSATTVMLVGFVNSGIMKLGQTISVIMGANLGTTVTSWLLSLTGISGDSFFLRILKPSSFTPILAVIGIFLTMMAKSEKKRDVGNILLGFAILMFGMETMSGSMDGLKESETFAKILVMFSNPIMGIVTGTILTAIIQSSSASVGILQALSMTGTISYSTAIPIILGQNIGTTITPILSSISGNTDSKRVAFTCLYIKMIGVIVVSVIFYALDFMLDFAFMDTSVNVLEIAIIHTLFNILSTIILMPFCSWVEKLAIKTIKGDKTNDSDELNALDERFLSVPSFAVEKSRELVSKMAELSREALKKSLKLFDNFDRSTVTEIQEIEALVDKYEDKLSSYLLTIADLPLSHQDSREVSQLLHVIGDVERISDHAVNILETAQEIHDKGIAFSSEAEREIGVMKSAVQEVLDLATDALIREDLETAKKVEPLEQRIDKLKYKIKNNHINRLRDGSCTVELGFVLSDLLTNCERVADHCSNIAVCLLEMENDSFETHEYLTHVKQDGENEFFEQYAIYKEKYTL
ncbi:MAG: Na/Pi cotransporter family protein [Ruminococcaceae bacterium]|nr:Na/Pi cotransporter family protein [Oscillospiraceae bacterium]